VKENAEVWARWREQRWSEKQNSFAHVHIKRTASGHLLQAHAPTSENARADGRRAVATPSRRLIG